MTFLINVIFISICTYIIPGSEVHPSAIISISDYLRLEMSLGLLSGYGSGSESEAEEDVPTGGRSEDNNSVHERLKLLAASSLALPPPPPPPEPEPLPNPLAHKAKKQKTIPGMSKKEMEMMMKNAKWLDIVTEEVDEESRPEFDYNTPLPFTATQEEGEPEGSQESESDYLSYVAEYQNYMANSANLLAGKEKSDQLAEEAAAEGSSSGEVPGTEQGGSGQSGQLWDEYMTKYQAWYNQYGAASAGGSAGSSSSTPALKQKSFEELLEQDRQLDQYFNSEPANEYNTQRDAFKSSFRGTRRYRMINGTNYNPRHFNSLSSGAKKFAEHYPKQKSVMVDKDAYVADKDLPENQDIKSNKQRKKDKWFQGMVDKKKGCKKCGFVFCRCYGWEFKPSHVK